MTIRISPFLIGSGSSGKAMMKSLAIAGILHPELVVDPVQRLSRGESLERVARVQCPVLLIANPHGLHAKYLQQARRLGIGSIIVEKPAVVRWEEIDELEGFAASVAVCHGYRQMWGPRTLKRLLDGGELGELIAIEGRYWQSSSAVRAISGIAKPSWKNDLDLNGPHDTLVDLGAHWADLAVHLVGEIPESCQTWLSYANAESPHRDTHVHLSFQWPRPVRAWASVSKTWHGTGNHLEVHVLGTKARASWTFSAPDEIRLGIGGDTRVLPRPSIEPTGSQQAPFHGLGWLEGYVDILTNVLLKMSGQASEPVPILAEHLRVMRLLLGSVS